METFSYIFVVKDEEKFILSLYINFRQWRTKELGTVWKSPSKQLLRRTLLLRTIFLFGFRFIPSFPNHPPKQCCGKKSTHSHPFCSKFNFVWGGRGGVASFSNITGNVPTLLTSIVACTKNRSISEPIRLQDSEDSACSQAYKEININFRFCFLVLFMRLNQNLDLFRQIYFDPSFLFSSG